MRIPQVDLAAQLHALKPEIMSAVEDVLESTQLFLGPHTRAFESEFAEFCGVSFAIGLANGTDALHLALRATGIGPGDEVITVSHTFIATIEAIVQVGARPVLVDIDPVSMTMDWRQLESRITPRTRAIIPVHLYGRLAEMEPVLEIAHAKNLVVIEDASQAHGAVDSKGRRAGAIGDIATFSFYFAKNLGAYGEAGAVTTGSRELDERVRLLRSHGESVRYHHAELGFNSRIDEIQAAILRIKLRRLDEWNGHRRAHAARYNELLGGLPLRLPELIDSGEHVYHQYVVRADRRDQLRSALDAAGIGTGIHYPVPVHLQPACRDLGYGQGDLPVTEEVARQVLSLPMYPELQPEQIAYVAAALRTACLAGPTFARG
jgi:dTDP-4-amino-4,6-dideoxygalactose transaminase